jgi:hypothetical protein
MSALKYANGEEVRLGDIVDVGEGHGPKCRVVAIGTLGQALEGFADDLRWLGEDILLIDVRTGARAVIDEIDPSEDILIERAHQSDEPNGAPRRRLS